MHEIVRGVSGGEIKEEINKTVKTLLMMYSNHFVEVIADVVIRRLGDRDCAQSLRIVSLSLSGSGFVNGEFTPSLQYHGEDGKFSRERQDLQNQLQRVISYKNLEQTNSMQNLSAFNDGDEKRGSLLWAGKLGLLFCLNTHTDSRSIWYLFVRCMECTPALDKVD